MEISKELLLCHYADKGLEPLIKLNQSTYSGREISENKYLEWEYFQNPDGHAIITTIETKDIAVSQFIILPHFFSIDGKIQRGSLSVNTLTHPDYRNRGLFQKLAKETFNRCTEAEILFTIGFPNPESQPIIKKKQIFEKVGVLPLLFIPLNPIKSLYKYALNKSVKTGNDIDLNISDGNVLSNSQITNFDFITDSDKYVNFIQKYNSEKQNITFRSLKYLQWRYEKIPKRKYQILKYQRENKIEALGIIRTKYIFGLRCAIIVDLISHINSKGIDNLLNAIYKLAIKNKIDLLLTTVPSHSNEYKLLKNFGFYSMPQLLLPQKLVFYIKRHTPGCPEQISDFQKWFLTFGDYDIF